MKRIFTLFLLILAFSKMEAQSFKPYFEAAYQQYPVIPRGTLEAMAYGATRMQNIIPDADMDHHHGPNRFGLFALIENGEGYWDNNLLEVYNSSGYKSSLQNFKLDIAAQVMAVAKRVESLCIQYGVSDLNQMAPVLKDFSEIPSNSNVNRYAQDLYAYETFYWLQNGFTAGDITSSALPVQSSAWFAANTFALLSSPNVTIQGQSISNGTISYAPSSTDYPPALWVAASTSNYSSRTTAITAVTIHTTQGSYSGSISWFQNATAQVSAHYVLRSSDGQVTQMVLEANKAWHVGVHNGYTIGLEHEGYVSQNTWYTSALYSSSAALVRDICTDRNINPTTCYNGAASSGTNVLSTAILIKGHQHYSSQTHTDPGIYWNWGTYYNLINNVTTVCNPVSGLAVANTTPNSTKVSWTAATSASSYTVEYKTSAATTWTVAGTTTNNSLLLSGLAAATTYNWRVKTNCSSAASTYQNSTFTTLPSSSTACTGTITDSGGTASNYGNGENWTYTIAPTGAASVALTFNSFGLENTFDYVYVYNGTSATAPLIGTYTGTTSPGTITSTGGALTLKFTSDGATVSWGFSASWACTMPPPPCNAPTSLAVSSVAQTTANLIFTAASNATAYNLNYRTLGSTTWNVLSVTGTSYQLTGLSSNTTYEWRLQTICSSQTSAFVSGANFTTLPPPCNAPTNPLVSSITNTGAVVSWTAAAGVASYTLQYKTSTATTWSSITVTNNTYTLSGLLANTIYQWQVKSNCTANASAYITGANFTTLPPPCTAPASLAVANITTTGATLSWAAVAGAAGYTVQYKTTTSATLTSLTATTNSLTLSGLASGVAYQWQVRTNCSANTSAFIVGANFTTLIPVCPVPTALTASNVLTSQATVSWTGTTSSASYVVEWKTTTATTWTTATVNTTTYTITGLTAATAYQVRVKTNCSMNVSGYSSTLSLTTQASCYDAWEANNSSGAATSMSSGSFKYGKICPSGTDVDWYKVVTTATSTITVNMTQLPKNYNLEHYFNSVFVVGSYNTGTTNETITRSAQPAGTYYFRVYAAASATDFDSNNDYKISATVAPVIPMEAGNEGTVTELFPAAVNIEAIDPAEIFTVDLFPNPTSSELNIKIESGLENQCTLEIYNFNGTKVMSRILNLIEGENLENLSVEELPAGMYFVRLNDGIHQVSKKLTIFD